MDGYDWVTGYTYGRSEGQPIRGANPYLLTTDTDDLYDILGWIDSYYTGEFSRNGANNSGGIGDGSSTYPTESTTGLTYIDYFYLSPDDYLSCPNAFFNGLNSIHFCQGYTSIDITGHEYAHAVNYYSVLNSSGDPAGLTYAYEPGALNESNSDVFGEALEYYINGSNDWLIGEDLAEGASRSMSDPASYTYNLGSGDVPYPDRFNSSNLYCGDSDGGGVHINSSVPNHAAYLMAIGGTFNNCTINGIGREKEERIFYRAETVYYTTSSDFNEAYTAILTSCQDLYGASSAECKEVEKALRAVEMNQGGYCSSQAAVDPGCALIDAAPSLGILLSQSYDTEPWVKRVGHHGAKIKSFKAYDKEGGISSVQADINGDGINEIVVAPEAGLSSKVKAFTKNGTLLDSFAPFGSTFNNGISLTAGDVNNDGKDEIIVAPLTKGTPKIKVFRYVSGEFKLLEEKSVFGSSVPGGLNISSGDVNGDGIDEIVVSPYQDKTKNDRVVKIYAYRNSELVKLASKRLYSNNSKYEGIKTITADMNGDGKAEIIATPSLNYGDNLQVYSYGSGELTKVDDEKVYSAAFDGITSIAAGDTNNDGTDEVVVSVRTEFQPYVFIYKLNDGELKEHDRIRVFDSTFEGGVNVTVLDVDGDDKAEVITAPYSGIGKVKVWDVESSNQHLHSSFWGFNKNFDGGINFSGSTDSPTLNGKKIEEEVDENNDNQEENNNQEENDTYLENLINEERSLLTTIDGNLSGRLAGKILLQVEKNGEGWYVYPDNSKKYFLGRPSDAFSIMRNLGLGATHEFITSYTEFPDHVVGKILLDVELNGEAYYIYPGDKKAYYLGRPDDAFSIMRNLGLGITNADIRKIDIGEV